MAEMKYVDTDCSKRSKTAGLDDLTAELFIALPAISAHWLLRTKIVGIRERPQREGTSR